MAINFPNSPTNGQIFTNASTSWIYDGIKWGLNTNIAVSNDSMPVGAILWYANTSTAPLGWIPADGSAVSRTTYATLFVVIGTTYGSGDGSTTFNVPSVAATTGKYYIRYTTSVGTVTTTSLSTSPVGTMLDWPVTSSYPTGFLRADGTAVSRTSYADLFALIGTTYGVGDGSSTFNLPNLVAAGSGSPVKIIKASLGGTVEPSTVAHASSHIRSGSDIIDGDRVQVDFTPTYYTRDSSPAQAGASTDLTAHLKGIDNTLGTGRIVQALQAQSTQITINTTAWTNIVSQTITTTKTNSKLICMFTGDCNANDTGAWKRVGIFIDGTLQYNVLSSTQDAGFQEVVAISGVFTVATAGSHTVSIQAQQGAGSSTFAEEGGNNKNNLVVLELG